jgi:hypothetical protein
MFYKRPNGFELISPLLISIIHQVLSKLGKILGPLQREVMWCPYYETLLYGGCRLIAEEFF